VEIFKELIYNEQGNWENVGKILRFKDSVRNNYLEKVWNYEKSYFKKGTSLKLKDSWKIREYDS